jgi:hypothetical protein
MNGSHHFRQVNLLWLICFILHTVQFTIGSNDNWWKKSDLQHIRLCGLQQSNDQSIYNKFWSHHGLESRQCENEKHQLVPCDERELSPINTSMGCAMLTVEIESIETYRQQLQEMFQSSDQDKSIRRMKFQYPLHIHRHVLPALDDYLTPRLWLRIEHEEFPWQPRHSTDQHHEKARLTIIIDRVHHQREALLTWMADVQYPSKERCQTVPLLVSTAPAIHPGWGTVFTELLVNADRNRNIPLSMYISQSNQPGDNAQFITGLMCPNEINKWECAFLPTTNCSIPDVVTDCESFNCVYEWGRMLFTNGTRQGQPLKPDTKEREIAMQPFQDGTDARNKLLFEKISREYKSKTIEIMKEYWKKLYKDNAKSIKKYKKKFDIEQEKIEENPLIGMKKYMIPFINASLLANEETFDHPRYHQRLDFIDVTMTNQLYHLFVRHNAFYRAQIGIVLHEVEKEFGIALNDFGRDAEITGAADNHDFNANDRQSLGCVATHIRRGDRVPWSAHDQLNITKYCAEHRDDSDRGCSGGVPFAAIDLTSIIHKAEEFVAPRVRHLFVMTDDNWWLEQEVKRFHQLHPTSIWKVVYLPWKHHQHTTNAAEEDRVKHYHHMRSEAGTASGVHFFASFQLLQHCEFFIGNGGSAVSTLVYEMMCERFADFEGICPPYHDMHHPPPP